VNDKPGISASASITPRPKKEVVNIGGGIGGSMSALKAAEDGWEVTIIERGSDHLLGSSNQTSGRMRLGFHYSDVETAEKLLTAIINNIMLIETVLLIICLILSTIF
jgi:glycine/D-amino acid oxidase-like deaminating enzyme